MRMICIGSVLFPSLGSQYNESLMAYEVRFSGWITLKLINRISAAPYGRNWRIAGYMCERLTQDR